MAWRLLTSLLVLGFALTCAMADATSGRDQPKGDESPINEMMKASDVKAVPVLGPHNSGIIVGFYKDRYSSLPPGLAKRGGGLPLGLERQLERNRTLPPGLQERIDPFPRELIQQLPPLPSGYTRGLIGGSAVIVSRRARVIVDIIDNLLSSSGL